MEFFWEFLSCSLIGINNSCPGTVTLFYFSPSYKVLSSINLHFQFAPYPAHCTLFAASWKQLALIPLCFCILVCSSHWETPFLHPLVSSCPFSEMWLRCLGSCHWPLPAPSWLSVQCASRVLCICLYMVLNKLPCGTHLSLPPDCAHLEYRNLSSLAFVPSDWQVIETIMKLIFLSSCLISSIFQAFYLLYQVSAIILFCKWRYQA